MVVKRENYVAWLLIRIRTGLNVCKKKAKLQSSLLFCCKCLILLSPGSDDLDPDLARLASLGFTGCLSVVHFNSISPLKAALLHPDTSPVVITGPLVQSNCGSLASANPYAAENTHHLSGKRKFFAQIMCILMMKIQFLGLKLLRAVYMQI